MALNLRTTRIFDFRGASKAGKFASLSLDEAERLYEIAQNALFNLVSELEESNQVDENLRYAIVDYRRAAVERAAVIGATQIIKRTRL